MERTNHDVYRKDGKIHLYKTGKEVYAGSRDSRGHGKVDSGEPVIFLHATAGCSHTWDKCIDKFAEHFTCYVIDAPGHDGSDIPLRKYTMPDYADAILDVLDAIGLQKTNIVGDHTGAMYAVDLAIRHPERVKRMVLDGLPYWNTERGTVVWERFFTPGYTDTTAYDVPVIPLTTFEAAKARTPSLDRATWEHSDAGRRRNRLWSRYGQEANTSYDTEAAGPKVKTPTLLIYGEGDILRRGEERAHAGIKGSILKVVPKASGAAHQGNPDEFAKLAIEFLLEGASHKNSPALQKASP